MSSKKVTARRIDKILTQMQYASDRLKQGGLNTTLKAAFWEATQGCEGRQFFDSFFQYASPMLQERLTMETAQKEMIPKQRRFIGHYLHDKPELLEAVRVYEDDEHGNLSEDHARTLAGELTNLKRRRDGTGSYVIVSAFKSATIQKMMPFFPKEMQAEIGNDLERLKKTDSYVAFSDALTHAFGDPLGKQQQILALLLLSSKKGELMVKGDYLLHQLAVTRYFVEDIDSNLRNLLSGQDLSEDLELALMDLESIKKGVSKAIKILSDEYQIPDGILRITAEKDAQSPNGGCEHLYRLPDDFMPSR